MKYNTTIEQQQNYVDELRDLWCKVAYTYGYLSSQEIAILDVLSTELNRLNEMKEKQNESN